MLRLKGVVCIKAKCDRVQRKQWSCYDLSMWHTVYTLCTSASALLERWIIAADENIRFVWSNKETQISKLNFPPFNTRTNKNATLLVYCFRFDWCRFRSVFLLHPLLWLFHWHPIGELVAPVIDLSVQTATQQWWMETLIHLHLHTVRFSCEHHKQNSILFPLPM